MNIEQDLQELESAEEFLDYFNIDYDPKIVHVNRLHILQRFHDYLAKAPQDGSLPFEQYAELLKQAYTDFTHSDAVTEKVFKVFKTHGPATISLDQFKQQVNPHATKI